jgi:hypothetical protein
MLGGQNFYYFANFFHVRIFECGRMIWQLRISLFSPQRYGRTDVRRIRNDTLLKADHVQKEDDVGILPLCGFHRKSPHTAILR